jgi:hypothetical protein
MSSTVLDMSMSLDGFIAVPTKGIYGLAGAVARAHSSP